jgi:uncharacterized OB-fold protein
MPYSKPLPAITPQSRPFWDAAKEGRLLLPRCDHCGAFHTYFEPWCNQCGGEGTHWEELSGRGRIWANCRFHRLYFTGFEASLPYNVAIVELDEGPRMVTNIVGLREDTLDEMPIGMPVRVAFDAVTDEVTLVKFAPAGQGHA